MNFIFSDSGYPYFALRRPTVPTAEFTHLKDSIHFILFLFRLLRPSSHSLFFTFTDSAYLKHFQLCTPYLLKTSYPVFLTLIVAPSSLYCICLYKHLECYHCCDPIAPLISLIRLFWIAQFIFSFQISYLWKVAPFWTNCLWFSKPILFCKPHQFIRIFVI